MASAFDFTVKIPSRFQNPWMCYKDLLQYVHTHPPEAVTIKSINDLHFYETVVKALKWEQNRLHLKKTILSLNLCDVVEDIEFSQR